MNVDFLSIKCPGCGAAVELDERRGQGVCSYCGAKVFVDDDDARILQHVDEVERKHAEAELKRAETEQLILKKKMEMAEQKKAAKKRKTIFKVILSLVLVLIGGFMLLFGYATDSENLPIYALVLLFIISCIWMNNDNDDDDIDIGDLIKFPSLPSLEETSYTVIESKLRATGFTNISCIPLGDLTIGLFTKPNTVESLTIKGKEYTSGRRKYPPDVPIVISYHSFR